MLVVHPKSERNQDYCSTVYTRRFAIHQFYRVGKTDQYYYETDQTPQKPKANPTQEKLG